MVRTLDIRAALPVLAALVAAGCMDRDLAGLEPVVETVAVVSIVQAPTSKVDILVVVDDSGSMAQEQAALAEHFPTLIHELMAPGDPSRRAVTDLRVGVISTDLGSAGYSLSTCNNGLLGYAGGDDGCLLHEPYPGRGCRATYPAFLERTAESTYTLDDMGLDFGCIATLGTAGCGFEQQMKAAHLALTDRAEPDACSEGFLRPDSILAVLWISDEEDCSVEDPAILDPARADLGHLNLRCYFHQEYLRRVDTMLDGLRALREDPERFVLAMIVGVPMRAECEGRGNGLPECLDLEEMQYRPDPANPGELLPSCVNPDGWGLAYPPRRFVQGAQLIGHNALVHSICNSDWRPAMDGVLELIRGAIDRVCFPRELALDPATCRAECKVVEILDDDRPCGTTRQEAEPPTQQDPDGTLHRRCVIPQAERAPEADGTCGATPLTPGWYYLPEGSEPGDCDQLRFTPDTVPEPLSRTQLECLSYVCPAERRCGVASNPAGRCCATGETCADLDPLLGGQCVPAG